MNIIRIKTTFCHNGHVSPFLPVLLCHSAMVLYVTMNVSRTILCVQTLAWEHSYITRVSHQDTYFVPIFIHTKISILLILGFRMSHIENLPQKSSGLMPRVFRSVVARAGTAKNLTGRIHLDFQGQSQVVIQSYQSYTTPK